MKKFYLGILFLISFEILSQDIISSQYQYTPFSINPAIVSAGNEGHLIANHRNLSRLADQEFNTSTLTLYAPIGLKGTKNNLGFGGSFLSDASGYQGILKETSANATLGYGFNLSKRNILSFSLGGEYRHRRIDLSKITTGSQWVTNFGYNPGLASGEDFAGNESKTVSINGGFFWQIFNKNNDPLGSLSIAAFHLNRPKYSWSDNSHFLPIRYVVTGAITTYKSRQVRLTPEFLISRASNNWWISAGPKVSFLFTGNPLSKVRDGSIDFAGKVTNSDMASMSMFFNQPRFGFGVTYDLATSSKNNSSGRGGAIELALTFNFVTKPAKTNKAQVIDTYSTSQVREFFEPENQKDLEVKPEGQKEVQKDTAHYTLRKKFYYAFNDSTLNTGAKEYLDDLAQLLTINNDLHLEIVGHSDNRGKEGNNHKVSLFRARQVAEYLESKGIGRNRMKVTGAGSKQPVAANDSEQNKSLNRRVEMFIYKN